MPSSYKCWYHAINDVDTFMHIKPLLNRAFPIAAPVTNQNSPRAHAEELSISKQSNP